MKNNCYLFERLFKKIRTCIVQKRQYLQNEKKIFQKGKSHSYLFWKAFQIQCVSSNYFSFHRHFNINGTTITFVKSSPTKSPPMKLRSIWFWTSLICMFLCSSFLTMFLKQRTDQFEIILIWNTFLPLCVHVHTDLILNTFELISYCLS